MAEQTQIGLSALQRWLKAALYDLEPQSRARLEAEYTAHFHEALAATGDEAQALVTLGNPAELNVLLRERYPNPAERRMLEKLTVGFSKPIWAWELTALTLIVTALQDEDWAQMSGLWLIVGAGLTLRTWAFRYTGARRLALLVMALIVPLHVILIGQGVPADALHWFLALGRSVLSVGTLLLIVLAARLPVWLQVMRRR